MKMYGASEPQMLYDVRTLFYVQETQLDKFFQELDMSIISANMAYVNHQTSGVCEIVIGNRGRGHMTHGRGYSSFGTRPKCQLYGKYGHVIVECWHRFDESFTPTQILVECDSFPCASIGKLDNNI